MKVKNMELPYNSFIYIWSLNGYTGTDNVHFTLNRIDDSEIVYSVLGTKTLVGTFSIFSFIIDVPFTTYYTDGDNTEIGADVIKYAEHKFTVSNEIDTLEYGKIHLVKVA